MLSSGNSLWRLNFEKPTSMTHTTRKLLLAIFLVALCVAVWYTRISYTGEFSSPPPPPAVIPEVVAPLPTPALATVGGTAPILATIDWADPQNPAAIPLSWRGSLFLLDTRNGLQVWDSATLKMNPLAQPLTKVRLLDNIWQRVGDGTLFAVTDARPNALVTLYWLDENQSIKSRLEFPSGFFPTALVSLSSSTALICAAATQRAIIVAIADGKLTQLTDAKGSLSTSISARLQDSSITGHIEGIGDIAEAMLPGDVTYKRQVLFNAQHCAWHIKQLPEPLASGKDVEIISQTIASFWNNPSIVAAKWLDPVTNEPQTLDAPLIWYPGDEKWIERQRSDFPGLTPKHLAGVAQEQWVYAAAPKEGRFAFLAPVDDRWRESTQRLPLAEGVKLLPIGNEGVLALLIDAKQPGRIVRLDPEKEIWLNARLRENFSVYDGAIPLNNGGSMIVEGSLAAHVSVISPSDPKYVSLPVLPHPQTRVSGVQLSDDSVVVFGGLHTACYASSLRDCRHGAQPSFRWIPSEKRWQPLPTLSVPFFYGEAFDGGNSGIVTSYRRSDFVLHEGNTLYYLSSNHIAHADEQNPEPTRLYRWSLDNATRPLATMQLSRDNATLIALDDGRLAAIGGASADEPPSPACQVCKSERQRAVARLREKISRALLQPSTGNGDDSMEMEGEEDVDPEDQVPQCDACTLAVPGERFTFARSCELYDRSSDRWMFGPFTHHPGGRAIKLANGRIFKFGLLGYSAHDAMYAAETADPALTQWVAAPPFPFSNPAEVSEIRAIGNQVVIAMANPPDRYVIWDDTTRSWHTYPLPRHSDWTIRSTPQYISPADEGRVLLIYDKSFEYLAWPPN